MKPCYGLTTLTLGAALAAVGVPAPATAGSPPAYVVYDTGVSGAGNGINNLGWPSGVLNTAAGDVHGALYIPGNVIDLGTLGGANSGVEWPIKNNHGLVVGISETATPDPLGETFSCAAFIPTNGHTCLPFLWQNGALTALPLRGGNNGFATGVNNAGFAVGWVETALRDPSCVAPQVLQFLAVKWGPGGGTPHVLPPYGGDSTSAATAINDAGEVVGISGTCDVAVGAFSAIHSLLWVDGYPIKLPTLGGAGWNTPMAINNAGAVVGFSDLPGDVSGGVLTPNFQSFLWTRERGIVNLGVLAGDLLSEATGINDFGQIVGTSFNPVTGASRVYLWQDGTLYDLNALVQTNAPIYLLASGDINDRGEITGLACVLVDGSCGSALHTFVAIVSPGGVRSDATLQDGARLAARPLLPAELRAQLSQRNRFGRSQPERVPPQ
jgi:probable HAF family extracellular repeat protein